MISKERLEKLINKRKKVYSSNPFYPRTPINLSPEHFMADFTGLRFKYKDCIIPYGELWETKSAADFDREFGLVERVDKLEFTAWEDFDNTILVFTSKKGIMCMLQAFIKKEENTGYIELVEGKKIVFSSDEYTKENYIRACRKAKELFLGVKVERK